MHPGGIQSATVSMSCSESKSTSLARREIVPPHAVLAQREGAAPAMPALLSESVAALTELVPASELVTTPLDASVTALPAAHRSFTVNPALVQKIYAPLHGYPSEWSPQRYTHS